MAPGRKSLRRIQLGKEASAGTLTAASVRMRWANAVLNDETQVEEIEEQVGIVGMPDRTVVKSQFAKIDVPDQPLNYEQFPYILAMAFGGPVVGTSATSTDGAVSFVCPVPVSTAAPIQTYTFEGGDDHEVERMPYAYCTKFKISGKGGEVLKVGASFEGRYVTTGTGFTTATALKYVEDIVFSKGKLYIDPVTSTAGTTQIVGQFKELELEGDVNIVPKWTGDGQLYFTFATYIDQVVKGKLVFEHDTAADGSSGAKYDWRNQNAKVMRLQWTGNAITSGGSYSNRTLNVDLPIKWTQADPLSDDKGNDLVALQFRSRYSLANTTLGNGTLTVVTSKNDGSTTNGYLW